MRTGAARQAEIDRYKRRSAEMREMIREAAENMALVGMVSGATIPWEHVERRRIWDGYPDTRSLTGRIMGDPIPERSALAGGA